MAPHDRRPSSPNHKYPHERKPSELTGTPAKDPPPANGIQTATRLEVIPAVKYKTRRHAHNKKICATFPPKMKTMQTRVGAQSSVIRDDGGCFDIWHDYMNLGRVLRRLCDGAEADRGAPGGLQRATPGPWSHIRTSGREDCRDSPSTETSSVSSNVSDTGSGGSSSADLCRFCKQNGESARVYRSHRLRSDDGRVVCPILWNYTCPICGATGDNAHTRRYCPQLRRQETVRKLSW